MLLRLLKFFSVVGVLLVLYYLRHTVQMHQIKHDSEDFVREAVGAIAASWDPAVFRQYTDPSLKSADIAAAFANYKKLGRLKPPISCDIEDFTSYKYKGTLANYIAANYECSIVLENAPATVHLTIFRFVDKVAWKIDYFNLSSPYFTADAKQ